MMRVLLLRLALLAIALGAVLVGVAGEPVATNEVDVVEAALPTGETVRLRMPAAGKPASVHARGREYIVDASGNAYLVLDPGATERADLIQARASTAREKAWQRNEARLADIRCRRAAGKEVSDADIRFARAWGKARRAYRR